MNRTEAVDGLPGSAGILPATGRRPAIVHAGRMPALPGSRGENLTHPSTKTPLEVSRRATGLHP